MKDRPFRIWYVILTGFISILVAFWITIVYIDRGTRSNRDDTCRVINAQLEVYREAPPSTPTGVKAKEAWAKLRSSLRCTEETP